MQPHDRSEKCREVFSLLSEYLNPELPPEACREIEAHISGCEPCVDFVGSLRKTVELCRQYRPEEMPSALAADARARCLEAWENVMARRGTQPLQ
jgi:hypothetical protein